MLATARVVIMLAIVITALPGNASNKDVPHAVPPLTGQKLQTLFLGQFSLEQGSTAVLILADKTREPITVEPILYTVGGEVGQLDSITIQGNDSKRLSLADLVSKLDARFLSGSLRLGYFGVKNGLVAELTTRDPRGRIARLAHSTSMNKYKSSVLQGVWWSPDDQFRMRVDLLNTTDEAVDGTVRWTSSSGADLKSMPIP